MPTRPSGRCTFTGCKARATWRGRCEEHQELWQRQSKHTAVINRALWERVRRQALRRDHNTCVICGKPGSEVDHIREVADGGALYDLANAQTLCHQCHLKKTYAMARKRRLERERRSAAEESSGVDAMDVWRRLGFDA
ncbi:MAG: HNH endonuclease [Bifidobacterium tibiigranuli]|jgi:5-methylcytosine-specific restriction endonuclease McrA|nr:HNH endonuclease [Bifidobacterium tibiigranuli]